MKDAGAKLIYVSDHVCWNDICEILAPKGNPIYRDDNHFRFDYNKYWASTLDFLVDF